jgi:hypothetical protein
MEYVVRKITRGKWEPKPGLALDEIGADAVTSDLRRRATNCPSGRAMRANQSWPKSSWRSASSMERVARLDLALVRRAALESDGVAIRSARSTARRGCSTLINGTVTSPTSI